MWRLAAIAVLALAGCGHGVNYSDGERAGTLTKFSRKGVFCPTWEGEMVLGGFRAGTSSEGGSTMVANVWEFTAENPADIKTLEAAVGGRIKVRYHEGVLRGWCTSDSGYFVRSVQVLE